MSIYVGENKATLFHGDMHPASFYIGEKKIAGYTLAKLQGFSSISWQAPYKARIRNIIVQGVGEQEKLMGKNLLDLFSFKPLGNGNIEFTKNSIILNIPSGNKVYGVYSNTENNNYLELGKTYTFSCNNVSSHGSIYGWRLHYNDKTYSTVFTDKITIPIEKKVIEVLFYFYFGDTLEETQFILEKPQIELGNQATPYEPYTGGSPAPNPQYPIQPSFLEGASMTARGKNLFDIPIIDKSIDHVSIECNIPYHITISATDNIKKLKEPIWRVRITKKNGDHFYIYDYDIPDKHFPSTFHGSLENPITEIQYRGIYIQEGSYNNIQVEIGDTPTPYEPYKQPQTVAIPTLRKIPDTDICDTYNAETGEIVRRVKELVLTGEEEWKTWGVNRFVDGFVGLFLSAFPKESYLIDNKKSFAVCTHLEYFKSVPDKPYSYTVDKESIWLDSYYPKAFIFNLKNSFFPDISTSENVVAYFKQFLADQYAKGTPVTVWYALAEPIIEKIEPSVMAATPGTTVLEMSQPAPFSAGAYLEDET